MVEYLQAEMIDQLSTKYLLKINGLPPECWCPGRNDQSIIDQVVKEISVYYLMNPCAQGPL